MQTVYLSGRVLRRWKCLWKSFANCKSLNSLFEERCVASISLELLRSVWCHFYWLFPVWKSRATFLTPSWKQRVWKAKHPLCWQCSWLNWVWYRIRLTFSHIIRHVTPLRPQGNPGQVRLSVLRDNSFWNMTPNEICCILLSTNVWRV